ncbi:hypothetical protein NKI04_34840, partial [Mesorhizobium sp. M0814]|uniref:hypothetical protein n=1 Tax=Mesorhizobium sp. M0814 TaxID=2957004 RepID=UPI00333C57F4
NPSPPQKPGYTSPTFACSHAGSQELEIKTSFLIQVLRLRVDAHHQFKRIAKRDRTNLADGIAIAKHSSS